MKDLYSKTLLINKSALYERYKTINYWKILEMEDTKDSALIN